MGDAESVFAQVRAREFRGTPGRIYLNAASYGPLPERTRLALAEFELRRAHADLTDADIFGPLGEARAAAARLVGADAEEIALVPNTNSAINVAVAATLRLGGTRRVVLVHDREFPANVYPWLALAERGFRVDLVPVTEQGLPDEDALLSRIEGGDVAAVSVSFVQFASGYRSDIAAIGAACRRHDTLFAMDAMQGAGAVPLNVRTCHADIVACGGQKWLCAPWGSGFAYIRKDLIGRFEPVLPGWLAFEATQDFTRLLDYRYELLPDARRFEVGSPGFQDHLGLQCSLGLLLELGIAAVWDHIRMLQQPIIDWACRNGVQIVSDMAAERRSGVLCIRPRSAANVFAALDQAGVRCAFRENSIRLSPHWYNSLTEIERVLDVLDHCAANP